MAISICDVHTDDNGRDKSQYGSTGFPISCYNDDLTKMSVNLHWHQEFEFIYITEGNVEVQAGSSKFLMEKNMAILINMNTIHSVVKGTEEKSRLQSLVFDSSLIADYPESIFWKKYIQPFKGSCNPEYLYFDGKSSFHEEIIALMDNAWNSIVKEEDGYENFSRFCITSAFHVILSNIEGEFNRVPVSQKQILKNLQMKKMLAFISENYMNNITLDELCSLTDLSESSCLRLFTEFTGETPIKYLRKFRLEKADELLKASGLSVTEVALNTGFNDISYFIKSYKSLFGKTPGESK